MEPFEIILKELRAIKADQDATFADLSQRLDAIDRETDIPLTPKQAAVYLGCSVGSIHNYRRRGMLTPKVKNGLVGYLRQDLKQLKKK